MSIPLPFALGNRSEYLAIPALTKLGFTVPVPRQEDHFGIDFIVHLASLEGQTVHPTGKAFGVQIKSNQDPLTLDSQHKRDSLYRSPLPFFLGVVSRQNLTLELYNTLNRLHCLWYYGSAKDLTLSFGGQSRGLPKADFRDGRCLAYTGKPILEIKIAEPPESRDRSSEIELLQSTMKSWIELENQNLSLKEQGIALFYWPGHYETNKPLPANLEHTSYTKYASWSSLPDVCTASKKVLMALSFYLRTLLPDARDPKMKDLMTCALDHVKGLEAKCADLLREVPRD